MNALTLTKLLHVLTVGLFAGGLLTMMMVQSFGLRATDDVERKTLAKTARMLGRLLVVPLIRLGFISGLALMFLFYSGNGVGKTFACAPVYVHIMLGFGLVAIGMAEAWNVRTRKFHAALEAGTSFADARPHQNKAWVFAIVSLVATLLSFYAGVVKVPSKVSASCAPAASIVE